MAPKTEKSVIKSPYHSENWGVARLMGITITSGGMIKKALSEKENNPKIAKA